MNVSTRGGEMGLRWSAIFAGAVLAIATTWTGELLGSLLALIRPGTSSVWGWLGGIATLGAAVIGALAGGWVAARSAGADNRMRGMLHGLVVWGVFGTASAMLFAVLGGNLALVAGATAGAVRLAVGFGMVALLCSLVGAVAGGSLGASAEMGERTGRGRFERRRATVVMPPPGRPAEPGVHAGPTDRGDVPPSVH